MTLSVRLLAVLLAAAAPARAQDGPEAPASLAIPWFFAPNAPPPASAPRGAPPESLPAVDIVARFESFQQEFARDFGGGRRGRDRRAEELSQKVVERLAERFEGGRLQAWYLGGRRLYDRAEGLYERVEGATRWTARGVRVDAQLESLVDGNVRVHVEKRVRGMRLGLDVNDAAQGRVGFRVGGAFRGYQLNLDSGNVATGQIRLGVRKRLD